MSSMVTRHKSAAAATKMEDTAPTEESSKRPAEENAEMQDSKRRKEDSDTDADDVMTGGDDVVALLSKAQMVVLTERANQKAKLKAERKKVLESEAKLATYKNRARAAEHELKVQKEEAEKAIAIQKEETEKAIAETKLLEQELQIAQEAKAKLEERLAAIVGLAHHHPGAPSSQGSTNGAIVKSEPDTVPTSPQEQETKSAKKTKDRVWKDDEKRILYNAYHTVAKFPSGRTNWLEIIKKLPGVSNTQAYHKFDSAQKTATLNSLEAAFVGEKVVDAIGVVGTVSDYEMEKETRDGADHRVGKWTVAYADGEKKELKSKELLEVWRRHKEKE